MSRTENLILPIILNEPVLALSWKEPYASLMLHRKIETRTWSTKYRGLVLICASKAPYPFEVVNNIISGSHQTNRIWETLNYEMPKDTFGKAIAIGRLVDCRPMTKADEDLCFVEYKEPWIEKRPSKKTGNTIHRDKMLWCHVYEDVKPIIHMPWHGCQGWKKLEEEFISKIQITK